MPRSSILIPVLIGLNAIIFLLWNFFGPFSVSFMMNHFLISWDALASGRFWTLLTAAFSHNLFLHIFFNMYVLMSFGPVIEQLLGTRSFLFFYLVAAIVSSLVHAMVSAFLLGEPGQPALGASGAIAGIILIFALAFPKEKIFLFGLIPIPALFGALAFIGLDVWGLIEQTSGGGLPIGHGAHIGGSVTGIIYYLLFVRRKYVLS